MLYALQASLALALLYFIYWLFLRRTSFHRLNRFVLIGIALAALLLPATGRLLPESASTPHFTATGALRITPEPSILSRVWDVLAPAAHDVHSASGQGALSPAADATQPFYLSPAEMLRDIYLLGLLFFVIRAIVPIIALAKLIRSNPRHRNETYTLVDLPQPSPPFSFFHWIFLHPGDHSEAQRRNILLHEQVHVLQYHTLDILFMEFFAALAWFHPVAWRLNKETKLNLEYLADHVLLNSGVEPKEYQYHLLQLTTTPLLIRTANHFNQSHLKKRIAMMNQTSSRKRALLKYALFLPVLTALCLVFASLKAQAPGDPSDIYLVVRPDLKKDNLRDIERRLAAEGINISFSNISFAGDQISGLRVVISKDGQTLNDLTLADMGQPLAEPLVFYWFRSRQGNPTLGRSYPADLTAKDLRILQNLDGLLKISPNGKNIELHGSATLGN